MYFVNVFLLFHVVSFEEYSLYISLLSIYLNQSQLKWALLLLLMPKQIYNLWETWGPSEKIIGASLPSI